MTATLATLTERTGRPAHDHLPHHDPIPILDMLQAQGDVIAIPLAVLTPKGVTVNQSAVWTDVPPAGIVVMAGQHDHVLVADPATCRWTTNVTDPERLALGILEAAEPVWLLHPEHGGTGLASGRWLLRGQREAGRRVAD